MANPTPTTDTVTQPPPLPTPADEDPDLFFRFQSRRSVVHSTRGIVASTSPLAGQAGLAILEAGGNAADAAVAASAVLAVVDPPMTGIGGDSFSLFYDAQKTHKVLGLNASGRTPQAATRKMACESIGLPLGRDRDSEADQKKNDEQLAAALLPHSSVHAVTVPAGAAGWVDAVEQFGSGRVTLAEVLAPAIRLAEKGFPVSKLSAHYWKAAEEDLRTRSPPTPNISKNESRPHTLLKPDSSSPHGVRAPREGEIIHNTDLAETMRRLATQGKAGFYEGPVAEAIVAVSKAAGGMMTLEDLKYHASLPPDIHEALSIPLGSIQAAASGTTDRSTDASGLRLWEHPPNGQGIVALLTIGILEELERTGKIPHLRSMQHNSAAYLHAVVSALRIAFADAGWFVADPDTKDAASTFDPTRLLRPDYLAERADLFDPERAIPTPPLHGEPAAVGPEVVDDIDCLVASKATAASPTTSDTVYLAVTDEHGNGCSFVNSMSDLFGSCLVVPGCGFALPNRGHMFRLGPANHPNVYAGGKRAYNTIIPGMVTRDGDGDGEQPQQQTLDTVFGVMGGYMQPQGHVQVLLNMHAFGMDPQTALDVPRVCVAPNFFWSPDRAAAAASMAGGEVSGQVYAEEGLPEATIDELRRLGYTVVVVRRFARSLFGRGQVIRATHDPVTGERVYMAGSDGRGDGHAVPLI
ncbi:gamma-glutamyltransferase [Sporothrix schenckii ATCC 58251]|uniref:Gamma-glutamyltransferase n=1 Tax=Sporothrix schenckii (strain ATCC 58251 / de Perez 2211183) TaxID=1391915 RepID=U7PNG5_SPOS1|nr:gamma-glutamyltransferase [Sporothrix schenckii ATCC 58251]